MNPAYRNERNRLHQFFADAPCAVPDAETWEYPAEETSGLFTWDGYNPDLDDGFYLHLPAATIPPPAAGCHKIPWASKPATATCTGIRTRADTRPTHQILAELSSMARISRKSRVPVRH